MLNPRPKTTGQVRAIYGLARQRGLDKDTLHELVADVVSGVRCQVPADTRNPAPETGSIRALTHAEAQKVIQRLKGRAFVPLRTLQYRRKKAGIQQIVAPEQLNKIVMLAAQRHWSTETLAKFCKRQCKRERPRTTQDANKVIEALKAMNEREGLWAA